MLTTWPLLIGFVWWHGLGIPHRFFLSLWLLVLLLLLLHSCSGPNSVKAVLVCH